MTNLSVLGGSGINNRCTCFQIALYTSHLGVIEKQGTTIGTLKRTGRCFCDEMK